MGFLINILLNVSIIQPRTDHYSTAHNPPSSLRRPAAQRKGSRPEDGAIGPEVKL